jgi:hypothetical protein
MAMAIGTSSSTAAAAERFQDGCGKHDEIERAGFEH